MLVRLLFSTLPTFMHRNDLNMFVERGFDDQDYYCFTEVSIWSFQCALINATMAKTSCLFYSTFISIIHCVHHAGTHYGWMERDSVEYKVCLTLVYMASTGN